MMEKYSFEAAQNVIKDLRNSESVRKDVGVFIARLAGPPNGPEGSKDWILLREFVLANHAAVNWYYEKQKNRRSWRTWYAIVSIAVILFLPVVVFKLSALAPEGAKDSPSVWLAQMTAIITGLTGAYRAMAAWLNKTFAASNLMQAATELKGNIYGFENDWRLNAFAGNVLTEGCKKALENGIHVARQIVAKQRDAYFAASAPPNVEILSSVKKASDDAKMLLTKFQSPTLARSLKKEAAEQKRQTGIERLKREMIELLSQNDALDTLIENKKKELAQESDALRKKVLTGAIPILQKSRDANEKALIEKQAKIKALET